MQVLLVFSSSQLGGAERSLSRMAFSSKEVDYQLATLDGEGPWPDWVNSQGCKPLIFGEGAFGIFGATWRLICYVRSNPVDIIYVCGARAAFFLRFLRLLTPKTKLVHGVRWNPNSGSHLDRFFRVMERFTHSLVDAWITNSNTAKQTLVLDCGIPSEKIFLIYNGLEALPLNILSLEDRPLEVLTVANLNLRKGHSEYLQIIHEVVKVKPDAKFVFVGRDDMGGAVQRAIEEAGLSGNVFCEGFQADVSAYYQKARLFVLPSLWGEGCPTSILEAFAHKIPVVAYGIDGIPELVTDKQDGVLINLDSSCSQKFGSVIVGLLNNIEVAKSMGNFGRLKVENDFTVTKCADLHETCFASLVGEQVEGEYN